MAGEEEEVAEEEEDEEEDEEEAAVAEDSLSPFSDTTFFSFSLPFTFSISFSYPSARSDSDSFTIISFTKEDDGEMEEREEQNGTPPSTARVIVLLPFFLPSILSKILCMDRSITSSSISESSSTIVGLLNFALKVDFLMSPLSMSRRFPMLSMRSRTFSMSGSMMLMSWVYLL